MLYDDKRQKVKHHFALGFIFFVKKNFFYGLK